MPIVSGAPLVITTGLSINGLNFGYTPIRTPMFGLATGDSFIEGLGSITFGRGTKKRVWPARLWVASPVAVGGQPAGSQLANEWLCRQLEELAGNTDLQPCYIKWSPSRNLPHDGWYLIENVAPNYQFSGAGRIPVDLSLTYRSPGTIRRMLQSLVGGAVATSYSSAAVNWASFPVNSTVPGGTATRTGSEGAIPVLVSPLINPVPYQLSATSSDWWLGGVHVYDTQIAGGNGVPTDGTAVNANWIEVFGTDHAFQGDMVVLNGLHLLLFQVGVANQVCQDYFWSANLGTPAWQNWSTLQYVDTSGGIGVLRSASLKRFGPETLAVDTTSSTSFGNVAQLVIRMPRGAQSPRLEFRPQTQANNSGLALRIVLASAAKIVYNSTVTGDPAVDSLGLGLAPTTDTGYGAAIIPSASFPFVAGLLWANPPSSTQPAISGTTTLGVGDTSGPGQNLSRQYSVFAFPFPTPQNLQAEAESGTLSGGFISATDTGVSGGSVAKLPNTTVAGAIDLCGTAWSPPAGIYDIRVRMRTTTGTSATAQMQIGIWDPTAGAWIASTTFAPNGVATTYGWKSAGNVSLPASHATQFRMLSTATATDDWWIDEIALVPLSSNPANNFPQDLANQYRFDREQERTLG